MQKKNLKILGVKSLMKNMTIHVAGMTQVKQNHMAEVPELQPCRKFGCA
uniref:Uncharacterized protein n=1 Tax=Arundo donax TaxID=35708 RepID=A0A0A8Z6Y9_ARUDO